MPESGLDSSLCGRVVLLFEVISPALNAIAVLAHNFLKVGVVHELLAVLDRIVRGQHTRTKIHYYHTACQCHVGCNRYLKSCGGQNLLVGWYLTLRSNIRQEC